jgi:hypothetical protein
MRSSTLKIHYRTHNEGKGFLCRYPGCNKGFSQYEDLNEHKIFHMRDKQFSSSSMSLQSEKNEPLNDLGIMLGKNNDALGISSDGGFLMNTLKLIERNHSSKKNNHITSKVKEEDPELYLPMNVINQAVYEQKQEIASRRENSFQESKEVSNCSNFQSNKHAWTNLNTSSPAVTSSHMKAQSPISANTNYHIFNLCSSPKLSNSPTTFHSYSIPNCYPNNASHNSPSGYLTEKEGGDFNISTFKSMYSNTFGNTFMNSPTFSPFATGNSPSFMSGNFVNPTSFSIFSGMHENVPGTPTGGSQNTKQGFPGVSGIPASCSTPIKKEFAGTKSKFLIDDFASVSTKSFESTNTFQIVQK